MRSISPGVVIESERVGSAGGGSLIHGLAYLTWVACEVCVCSAGLSEVSLPVFYILNDAAKRKP